MAKQGSLAGCEMKRFVGLLILFPGGGAQASNPCVVSGSSVEIGMTSQLTEDTGLSQKFLGAAQMEQLSSVPVGHFLAMQYAVADHNSDIQRPGVTTLSIDRYYDIYFSQQAVNLTVKYTYTSVAGKRNIYIGTSIVNSEECSIRFNGYITVQREF